ncbi:MAG: MarR family winged helix-turn-helix transcriptional regulator [Gemmatimonadota bacterium]
MTGKTAGKTARDRQGAGRAASGGAPADRSSPGMAPAGSAAAGPGAERAEWGWVWGDRDAQVPLDAPLPALISVALRLLGAFLTLSSQDISVSPAGLSVLRLLAARDGLKSSEVAERGWWTPGTVTSVADVLVRDGYVERRRDEADRRVVRLHLTGPGREVVGEAISAMAPKWQQAFDYIDPADEPVIRRFLVDTITRFGTLVREERGN